MSQQSDVWSLAPSAEELTWLKASILIGEAPRDQDPFASTSTATPLSKDFYLSPPPIPRRPATPPFPPTAPPTGTQSLPCTPPKSQWIYRRPKPPASPRIRSANPNPHASPYSRSSPRPAYAHATPFLTRSISNASSQSAVSTLSKLDHSVPPADVLWSSPIRPRTRPERTPPVLKTIPSQSQIDLTPTDLTVMDFSRSTPKKIIRQPSFASTISSCSISGSTSQSSSRSESPVTPGSVSGSPYSTSKPRRPNHRRYTSEPDKSDPGAFPQLSASCPPSKSILARSPSIRTNGSSHTINKSVKFAATPVVHYAACWDFEVHAEVEEDECMGISVDDMDLDDSFDEYRAHLRRGEVKVLDLSKFRELHSVTPTPEREKSKSRLSSVSVGGGKGLKRLMGSVTKKPSPTTRMETDSAKPVISLPYALGTLPPSSSSVSSQAMRSTTSLRSTQLKFRKTHGAGADSSTTASSSVGVSTTGGLTSSSHLPTNTPQARLRHAPSVESFRSTKSTAARSVRSVGSLKSSMSTRGFRAWLGRAMGWSD